jgi:predicted phage baseplate assembly protein
VVQGGNGTSGAPISSGTGNVTARYRVGSGLAGRVGPGSLTTLLTRPSGLRAVVNPLAAEGGADPEPPDQLRQHAPATVRALGRAVSLRDIDDILLLSGNIAKSQAVWLWNRLDRLIHVSVAAPADGPLSATLRETLVGALDAVRDPSTRVEIGDARRVRLELHASVVIDARAEDAAAVVSAVDATARRLLGFEAARLGRGIALSDVIAALASVPLVVGVDVDRFGFAAGALRPDELDEHGVEHLADSSVAPVQPRLRAFTARPDAQPGSVRPAELLLAGAAGDISIGDGGRG